MKQTAHFMTNKTVRAGREKRRERKKGKVRGRERGRGKRGGRGRKSLGTKLYTKPSILSRWGTLQIQTKIEIFTDKETEAQ
jgi:ribosomal protein L15